jgi:K+-transporting ATPase ATPase B chain
MQTKTVSIFDTEILVPAIGDAFKKLNPRLMVKNPVMFVTMVGAIISTVDAFRSPGQTGFVAQIALWLWFTVLLPTGFIPTVHPNPWTPIHCVKVM